RTHRVANPRSSILNPRSSILDFFLRRRETRGSETTLTLADNHEPGSPERGAHPVRNARRANSEGRFLMTIRSWNRNLFARPVAHTIRKAPHRVKLTLEVL